jgi:hypothetical protein
LPPIFHKNKKLTENAENYITRNFVIYPPRTGLDSYCNKETGWCYSEITLGRVNILKLTLVKKLQIISWLNIFYGYSK